MGFRDKPKIDIEPGEGLGYLVHAVLQSACDGIQAMVVIGRTEWLRNTVRSYRNDCGGIAGLSTRHELYEELAREAWHIAGQHQVPVRVAAGESGMQARKGAAAGEDIFNDGIAKVSIPSDRSDQSYVIRDPPRLRCNVFDERTSLKGQKGLIAAHARTAASSQHEHGALHGEMITLEERARP
jgi:hypothetical protein